MDTVREMLRYYFVARVFGTHSFWACERPQCTGEIDISVTKMPFDKPPNSMPRNHVEYQASSMDSLAQENTEGRKPAYPCNCPDHFATSSTLATIKLNKHRRTPRLRFVPGHSNCGICLLLWEWHFYKYDLATGPRHIGLVVAAIPTFSFYAR